MSPRFPTRQHPCRPSRAQNRQLQMLGIQRHLSAESTLTFMQEKMCVSPGQNAMLSSLAVSAIFRGSYELNQKTFIENTMPTEIMRSIRR